MKRKPMDTLLRQWAMLTRIPRYPRRVTVAEISNYLENEGYLVDKRTIQRDLDKLSAVFPMTSEMGGRTNYWYWLQRGGSLDVPAMSPSEALVLRLSKDYLSSVIPKSVSNQLGVYFDRAENVLKSTSMEKWASKVSMIHQGPVLEPPKISEQVLSVVYEALLTNQSFSASYLSRTANELKDFEINPLGLVIKNNIAYLVCTLWSYEDIRQLAIHRIAAAEPIDKTVKKPAGFNLKKYVHEDQSFNYPTEKKSIRLKLLFDESAAYHLYETPLSKDQTITEQPDSKCKVEATVMDTMELRWWLKGFGAEVEVLSPKKLRDDFKEMVMELNNVYLDAT